MTINFTGRAILAFGRSIPATCVVRNELNGWRKPNQVVRTIGQTIPNDKPYQPRPFPPGEWEITRVVDMGDDTEYWPEFIDTAAIQIVREWVLKNDEYFAPAMRWITGRGYGIHHARHTKDGELVKSNTTLGCINIADPDDAEWLGGQIREALGMRQKVFVHVPKWSEWK